jgi:hypothetical protein
MRSQLRYPLLIVALAGVLFMGSRPSGGQDSSRPGDRDAKARSQAASPALAELYESGTVNFSAPAPTITQSRVQCDADGNVYPVYYSGSIQQYFQVPISARHNLPLTKLDMNSKEVVQFQVPLPPDYPFHYPGGFYVTPRGGVYLLLEGFKHGPDYKEGPNWPHSLVVKYKDDGSVDSVTTLELPAGTHLQASRLAVFGDGNLLVTGVQVSGPRRQPVGPLTAVFDRDGNYVSPVALDKDVWAPRAPGAGSAEAPPSTPQGSPDTSKAGLAKATAMLALTSSFMLGSPDGNIYLIRSSSPARVFVISPAGKSLRDFSIKPPEQGMTLINATFGWQGQLLVEFSTQPSAQNPHPQMRSVIALVDPETGILKKTYALPPMAGVPACVSPRGESLFTRTGKDGKLEVAKYLPR